MRASLVPAVIFYALVILGLATFNRALLVLALPFAVYLSAGVIFAPREVNLQVTRECIPQRTRAHLPVQVRVEIANLGEGIELLHIADKIPQGLSVVEGENAVITSLKAGERLRLEYVLEGKRGVYALDGLEGSYADALGILQRKLKLHAPADLICLPVAPRLRRVAIRPRQTQIQSGSIPARLGGRGVEFFGVRHYQPGDSLRHINWHLSARFRDDFYANEFEQERVAEVWLILDARFTSDVSRDGDHLFDHTVSATAALAQALLSDGNRVGLLVYGGYLDWTYPGYGKYQRERIWQALARARTGESLVFSHLQNLPTRLLPIRSQLILISPLQPDDAGVLIHLRAHGYNVLVISPDAVAYESRWASHSPAKPLGERMARLERRLLFRQLRHAGVQVLNWNVDVPFDRAMQHSLMRLPPWHFLQGVRV